MPKEEFNEFSNKIKENLNFLYYTKPINEDISRNLKFVKNEYPNIYQLQERFYDQYLEIPISPLRHIEPCPYCFKNFHIDIALYSAVGKYACPHCSKLVKYTGTQYTKPSSCYITTSTIKALGGHDNSLELMAIRSFRDNWLMKQVGGCRLIDEYYKTAPSIVELIDEQVNPKEIYRSIWNNYLKGCYQYITQKEYFKAKSLYIRMVINLKNQYLN